MAGYSIKIEGLEGTIHALERAAGELIPEIRAGFIEAAEKGRDVARGFALAKGLVYHEWLTTHGQAGRMPGDLVRKIVMRPIVRGASVVSTSATTSKGYGRFYYPGPLERSRPYMAPMAEAMQGPTEAILDEKINRIYERQGF